MIRQLLLPLYSLRTSQPHARRGGRAPRRSGSARYKGRNESERDRERPRENGTSAGWLMFCGLPLLERTPTNERKLGPASRDCSLPRFVSSRLVLYNIPLAPSPIRPKLVRCGRWLRLRASTLHLTSLLYPLRLASLRRVYFGFYSPLLTKLCLSIPDVVRQRQYKRALFVHVAH